MKLYFFIFYLIKISVKTVFGYVYIIFLLSFAEVESKKKTQIAMATKSELPTTSQLLDKIFHKKSDYQNLTKKLKKNQKNEKNYKFMNDFEVPDCSRKDDVVYQEYRALKLQREQVLEDLQEKQEQQQQKEQQEKLLKNSDKNNNCEKSKSSKS